MLKVVLYLLLDKTEQLLDKVEHKKVYLDCYIKLYI